MAIGVSASPVAGSNASPPSLGGACTCTVAVVDWLAWYAAASAGTKLARMERDPTGRAAVVAVAVPDTRAAEPSGVEPPAVTSVNSTVPSAAEGATVAVSVTAVPGSTGVVGSTASVVVVATAVTAPVIV